RGLLRGFCGEGCVLRNVQLRLAAGRGSDAVVARGSRADATGAQSRDRGNEVMESGVPTGAASSDVPSARTAPTSHAVDAYTAAQAAQDAAATHSTRTFKIWRGDKGKGQFVDFTTDVVEGMVVLDAVH